MSDKTGIEWTDADRGGHLVTEGFTDQHWLKFDAERNIIGCQCGFAADQESDCGYGDSVVEHLRAEAAREALLESASEIFGITATRTDVASWLCDKALTLTGAPREVPRCQNVSPSPWGATQCALPDGHDGRHAYEPSETS